MIWIQRMQRPCITYVVLHIAGQTLLSLRPQCAPGPVLPLPRPPSSTPTPLPFPRQLRNPITSISKPKGEGVCNQSHSIVTLTLYKWRSKYSKSSCDPPQTSFTATRPLHSPRFFPRSSEQHEALEPWTMPGGSTVVAVYSWVGFQPRSLCLWPFFRVSWNDGCWAAGQMKSKLSRHWCSTEELWKMIILRPGSSRGIHALLCTLMILYKS